MSQLTKNLKVLKLSAEAALEDLQLTRSLLGLAVQRLVAAGVGSAIQPPRRRLGAVIRLLFNSDARLLRASGLFDESYYCDRYRDQLEPGQDPVEHYLTTGARAGCDPHELFSTQWYQERNPDVAASAINPLIHFIRFGHAEERSPHPLFDVGLYRFLYPEVTASAQNPLQHYLEQGAQAGLRPHWLFDGRAYLENYPEVRTSGMNPLLHYLRYGLFTLYKPHWSFDPSYYLRTNPEVLTLQQNPLVHFITKGARQGRNPSPDFNVVEYVAGHHELTLNGENPLLHFVRGCDAHWLCTVGAAAPSVNYAKHPRVITPPLDDPAPAPPPDLLANFLDNEFGLEVRQGILTAMARCRLPMYGSLLPSDESDPLHLTALLNEISQMVAAMPCCERPDATIIMPVFNQLHYTLASLYALLLTPTRYSFEIIIADDCSTDATRSMLGGGIGGCIRYVATAGNSGFIVNCNTAAQVARGRYLVLLNNDTWVLPGWLDELLGTLEDQPGIGLVGSKLIYPYGRLQEAGGIIWQDGSAWNYGRYDNPRHPKYSYQRDVDYLSGASIALPYTVWCELGGFDTRYEIAYGEDSDLAFRVRAAGRRVVLQPLSMLIHFEGVSSGTDLTQGVKAYQVSNAKKLFARWKRQLADHRPNGEQPELEKERWVQHRVLVIDHCTPTPDQDAGSLTCLEIMRAFMANGYKVTFIPEDNFLYMPKETRNLQRIGIEAIYYPFYTSVDDYLQQHGHLFDVVLVFRSGAASRHLATIRKRCPGARVLYHTSDLHFVREQRQLEVEGVDEQRQRQAELTRKTELALIHAVDLTIVHSTYEQELLSRLAPTACTYVFPWILDVVGCGTPFEARNGLIFLGGYRHIPNVDAVRYFVSQVWPLVRERLPDAVFYVAGSHPPPELTALDGKDNVVVTGFIDDLRPYFEKVRLSVAPIRYGAGIKGKVAMSMAYGVPVVATRCAAEGMGLLDGKQVLIEDDSRKMADKIIALYQDESQWRELSEQSMEFVRNQYGSALGRKRVNEMVTLSNQTSEPTL